MKKNILYIILIITSVSCADNKKTEQVPGNESKMTNTIVLTEKQISASGITTGVPEERSMSAIIKVNGRIDVPPQNMFSVSMPLGGYLRNTQLLPGMHVKKGEVIAVMEDQQYIQLQQDYLTVKTKMQYLETELQRQKELNQGKAASDKVLQQAQLEYNTQKITQHALAEKLKLININPQALSENSISKSVNIYSPINGFVSRVNVNIGKYVNPADILFELINPDDIHLNLKLFEKDLAKLSIGLPLVAYTNMDPGKKYKCEISLISKDLSADKTADVHCHFEKYDHSLIPGMYMNAEIRIKNGKTFALPDESIVSFEGASYVFLGNGQNRFQMTPVQTGLHENGYSELINPEKLNDKKIVTKGAYTLLMALKNKAEE